MKDGRDFSQLGPVEIQAKVQQLSIQALDLAKDVAAHRRSTAEQRSTARKLDDVLGKLWPAVDALPPGQKTESAAAWTDARLDLDYVSSEGQLPTSVRLFHYLEEQKQSKKS